MCRSSQITCSDSFEVGRRIRNEFDILSTAQEAKTIQSNIFQWTSGGLKLANNDFTNNCFPPLCCMPYWVQRHVVDNNRHRTTQDAQDEMATRSPRLSVTYTRDCSVWRPHRHWFASSLNHHISLQDSDSVIVETPHAHEKTLAIHGEETLSACLH